MNFLQFKNEYINTLESFLEIAEQDYEPGLIASLYSQKLANELADMEEENPVWVEKIEDQLAKKHELQNSDFNPYEYINKGSH